MPLKMLVNFIDLGTKMISVDLSHLCYNDKNKLMLVILLVSGTKDTINKIIPEDRCP